MYKKHFGLERRIFRGNAAGADVFVGPQTAKILSSVKKALSAPDGVVTLTGPVGCGKSTVVAHSLGAISGKNAIVRVGRFPLQRGELLDLLFDHMRVQQRPQSGNQKLALFRKLLFNLAQNDSRMFVLVEDAPFLGPDMLAELEVVTAADTGPSDGAAIVLMGDDYLREMLASKPLARLRQRIRLRRQLEPSRAEELGGYLRHCFRQAGGDFDRVFASGATDLLHELSGGILRVVNNLVESSMEAAADAKATNVDLELVSRIAGEEFGLTGTFTRPPEISSKQPEPRHSDDATAELVALSLPEPEPDAKTAAKVDDDDIPQLIQDTQPALAILNDAPAPAKTGAGHRTQHTLPDIEALSAELGAETPIPELHEPVQPKRAMKESAPGRGPKLQPNADSKPEPKPQPKAESRPEPKSRPEADCRAESKPRPKAESKPESKPRPKAESRPEPQSAPKSELKPAPKRTAVNKPKSSPTPAGPVKAEQKPGTKPQPAPAAQADTPEPPVTEPELTLELEDENAPATRTNIPTLSDDDTPAWDRDPTLAELRPDLDALERAMAVAQGRDKDDGDEPEPVPAAEPVAQQPSEDEVEEIPEITLDDSINRKVDREALERQKRQEKEGILEEEQQPAKDEITAEDRAREEEAEEELEKIAAGLARAKSIEDVDDKMAETLFGEELSVAAAAVAARVAEEAAAAAADASEASPVPAAPAQPARSEMEKEFENVWGEAPGIEVSIDSDMEDQRGGLDLSASQRLATVRALNTGKPEGAPVEAANRETPATASPDPIEEQITTSLTQTMKALKVNPDPAAINDDDDDERKGGFFSRFRRS
jgi:type II secretory pathway predicted ATPase ExeA